MNFIKENIKNIIIIILLILFIGASIIIYRLLNEKEKVNLLNITGTVIVSDASYVIIETDLEDYLVSNIKGTYRIGDEVKFSYLTKDLNEEETPKKINKIKDEELIKSNYIEEENKTGDDTSNNNQTANNSSLNNNSTSSSNINSNDKNNTNNSNNTINSSVDGEVLSYFNDLKSDIDGETIKNSVKNGFITVVDFLFYEGKIKGYTFSELSSSAKLKVLSMALYFDTKIEEYFPGYKETISSTASRVYTNVKEKIITAYLDITATICSNNGELCASAKEEFKELKENFGLTWSLIKDIAGDGITRLKDWYEIWSGK